MPAFLLSNLRRPKLPASRSRDTLRPNQSKLRPKPPGPWARFSATRAPASSRRLARGARARDNCRDSRRGRGARRLANQQRNAPKAVGQMETRRPRGGRNPKTRRGRRVSETKKTAPIARGSLKFSRRNSRSAYSFLDASSRMSPRFIISVPLWRLSAS
jgi:hypothetical protein